MKNGETTVDLRVLGDHSVIEVFGQQGRARIASRVYPDNPNAVKGGIFMQSGSVKYGLGAEPDSSLRHVWENSKSNFANSVDETVFTKDTEQASLVAKKVK